jgi:hypothetical protein
MNAFDETESSSYWEHRCCELENIYIGRSMICSPVDRLALQSIQSGYAAWGHGGRFRYARSLSERGDRKAGWSLTDVNSEPCNGPVASRREMRISRGAGRL